MLRLVKKQKRQKPSWYLLANTPVMLRLLMWTVQRRFYGKLDLKFTPSAIVTVKMEVLL